MTISGLDTPFHHSSCLSTLFDQAVNVSSIDNFVLNPRSRLLTYHRCCPYLLPHQAMNVSNIYKPTYYRPCSMSLSTSCQTPVSAGTVRSFDACSQYSYNFCHRLDMADSLKMMNQELLRRKDWVSPTVLDSQKKFAELHIIDFLMIESAYFNTLMQRASHAKNMEIFSISICNIEKALALKSTINLAKKLLTEYHDFLNVFSRADSDILLPHCPYDHKILLM